LQGDIATSTMEAEYSALSMAMRDLLPFRELLFALQQALGLDAWFRSKLDPEGLHPIIIQNISTDLQRADIFTKGLSRVKFQSIRKLLCGW
jgi:hypothetical protein